MREPVVESDSDLLTRWLAATAPEQDELVADRGAPADLSFGQTGMWIAQTLRGPADASLRMRHTYRIRGPLDVAALGEALNDLVARHETLRTVFRVSGGELRQSVLAPVRAPLTVETAPADAGGQWLEVRTTAFFRLAFDLAADPPIRARLFRLDDHTHVLMLIIHHIANDGWSMDVLNRDLGELYDARLGGRPPSLVPLPRQYLDFAVAERRRHHDGEFGDAVRYWRDNLAGYRPFALAADHPARSMLGARRSVTLAPELAGGVDRVASEHGATGFAVLLANLAVVLARWCGVDDLILGVAHAGRSEPGTEDLIGPFAGVLPLRVRVAEGTAFPGVLGQVRDALLAGNDNAIPLDLILQEIPELREATRSGRSLLAAGASSHLGFSGTLRLAGLTVTYEQPREVDALQPLAFYVFQQADGFLLALDHPVAMFDEESIDKLLDRYVAGLTAAIERR
jgi:hypothetical protein